MIQVIDGSNRVSFADALQSYAELRHRVFVERLGWNNACAKPGLEQDQFDTEDAVYMLVQNKFGQVVGGARLLDTSRNSLLCRVFRYLVDGGPTADPRIFEVTRFVVSPVREQLQDCGDVCAELLWGLQEYAAWRGMINLVSVSYLSLEPILRRSGYRFRRLGGVVPMEGVPVAALMHDVDKTVLQEASQRVKVKRALLKPRERPFATIAESLLQ